MEHLAGLGGTLLSPGDRVGPTVTGCVCPGLEDPPVPGGLVGSCCHQELLGLRTPSCPQGTLLSLDDRASPSVAEHVTGQVPLSQGV